MTDDRSLERAARSWIEAGPSRAPYHAVEAALHLIATTPQERGLRVLRLPWRRQTMNRIALFGATAVALVAVGVGGLLLSSRSNPGVGGQPIDSPSPATSPSPGESSAVRAIPVGTYATPPLNVADIQAQLDADQLLTASDKDAIIKDVLVIDGRSTLATYIVVGENSIDMRLSRDGGPPERDTTFPVTWVDADRYHWATGCCGEQTWGVTRDGDSYRLVARSPASGRVELFVRRILFEYQPFSPVP